MMGFFRYLLATQWKKYNLHKELKKRFPTCSFAENIVIRGPLNNLKLGKNVVIQSNVFLHLGGMDWCQNTGSLEIGDDSILSPNTVIYATGPGGVTIGDRVDCGPGVAIFSSRTDYRNKGKHIFEPVLIGNDVIIYSNAILSPGIRIGDGACIAGGSVITRDVASNQFVGGTPAKFIKTIM